ncbi:MAG: tRNA pseudouridine(55) synthase TruB [Ignavibacteria bacterium]|nr:tRNA pseudouridine(55) synthase TruB [Ignavibacteria bacterium]
MILCRTNLHKISDWLSFAKSFGAGLLVDKPKNWTSFDVVNKLRKELSIKKIGHTGTLDPFATGLLILLFNKFTKKQQDFINLDKKYIATIKLGATTKTFDPTSEEENIVDISGLTKDNIIFTISSFIGEYEQVPPMFSAKKISGTRLYKLARKNQQVEIKPSIVKIHSIEIINISLPFVEFEISCSKGTYIRSLANDIGKKLGVGAYLFDLRRTQIGNYFVNNALSIEEFLEEIKKVL